MFWQRLAMYGIPQAWRSTRTLDRFLTAKCLTIVLYWHFTCHHNRWLRNSLMDKSYLSIKTIARLKQHGNNNKKMFKILQVRVRPDTLICFNDDFLVNGTLTIALAMATRCFCPPLSCPPRAPTCRCQPLVPPTTSCKWAVLAARSHAESLSQITYITHKLLILYSCGSTKYTETLNK